MANHTQCKQCDFDTRTRSSTPAAEGLHCDHCRFVKDCSLLYFPPCEQLARQDEQHYRDAAKAEREKVVESLDELRKYANGEYKESDLSDNEREMRIHLEYENRIWGIMKSLRAQQEER